MKLAAFVFSSIAFTIQYYSDQYKTEDLKNTLEELKGSHGLPNIEIYDFIVVGGGTGGCVVAGRLSVKFKVLLLEAGGHPVLMVYAPYFADPVASDSDINYSFESVPQKNASFGNGGIVYVQTGKMKGGSGSYNDIVYNRGSPHDYDNYASILEHDSWNYANVLQYFKKSETFIGKLFNEGEEDYYGQEGPLIVDTDLPLILDRWFAAGTELGYNIGDANGYQKESFTPAGKLIYEEKRETTYKRYIKPFMDTRENLTVIPYALASQILIDDNNKAYGLGFSRHGIQQIAHASKEVIVSTGSFVSPILLMQSSVGPAAVLQEANVNLPGVGQNLRDHVFVSLSPIKFNATARPYFSRVAEAEFEEKLKEYVSTGVGVFGNLQEGPQALIFSSKAAAEGKTEWPDARITFCLKIALEDDENPTGNFWVTIDRPKSNGFITLNTTAYKNGETDLTNLALIDFKMLEDPSDVEVVLEHMKISLKIIEDTNAFKEIEASFKGISDPACIQFPFRSDDYWRCHIRQKSESAIHMVGTCSMGVGTNSVTDSKFKVKGVSNLRVVDASVFPLTPNANLNLAVIMQAEKASDEILASLM